MCEWGRGAKAGSTLRCSQAVPHPSTNRALCRLTLEVERDPVHSTRYGRQRQCASEGRCPGGRGMGGGHATPRVSGQRFEIVVSIPPVLGGDKCLKSLGQALPARESQKGPEEAGQSQRKSQREPERERERESQTEPARVRELPLSPPLPPNGSYKSPRESPSSASGQASAKDAAARGVNSDAVLTSS